MRLWQVWRSRGAARARAARFVGRLQGDVPPADIAWLAGSATGGDVDHARWELRYLREALGLLLAERDALDDRTASTVARALAAALASDPAIARGKLAVAEAQLNARLRAYATALDTREGGGTAWRLGQTLLAFAGARAPSPDLVAAAGELVSRHLAAVHSALQAEFGAPAPADDARTLAVRAGG